MRLPLDPDRWLSGPETVRGGHDCVANTPLQFDTGRKWNAMLGLGIGVLCILLAVVKVTPANSGESTEAEARQLYQQVELQLKEKLGVDVTVQTLSHSGRPRLPDSYDEISLRYPARPGITLPDAVEFKYQGRRSGTVMLRRFVEFNLPVLQARRDVLAYVPIEEEWLEVSNVSVAPGSEVMLRSEEAVGQLSRIQLSSGAVLRSSKLKKPFDVERGQRVTLIVNSSGVASNMEAVAQGNAYLGQHIIVKRSSDGERFSGEVQVGPCVVAESD